VRFQSFAAVGVGPWQTLAAVTVDHWLDCFGCVAYLVPIFNHFQFTNITKFFIVFLYSLKKLSFVVQCFKQF
jgi:hypothetical protein